MVVSNRTALPEVVGGAGFLVDAENVEALAQAIKGPGRIHRATWTEPPGAVPATRESSAA